MAQFSYQKAAGWAGAGLGVCSLAGIFEAATHYLENHFETLADSFSYVAQPEQIAIATVMSLAFGAFMEYKNCYYQARDQDEAARVRPHHKP